MQCRFNFEELVHRMVLDHVDRLLTATDPDHITAAALDLAHCVKDHVRVLPAATTKLTVRPLADVATQGL